MFLKRDRGRQSKADVHAYSRHADNFCIFWTRSKIIREPKIKHPTGKMMTVQRKVISKVDKD